MKLGFRALSACSALAIAVVLGGCVTVSPSGFTPPPTQSAGTAAPTSGFPTLPPLPTFVMPTLPPIPTFELPTIDLPTFPGATAPPGDPPTAAPPTATGEPTVIVVIGDQTYQAFAAPNCNHGLLDADTWGIEYGNMSAASNELSSVRIIDAPDTTAAGERIVSIVVMVGSILAGGSTYILQGDRFTEPQLEYTLTEAPDGSVLAHARGQSMDSPLSPGGATVDVTVRCPTVQR